jgi:hypothetical protein
MDDEELRDLVDVLRQPLQGRPVLVPLGTQAFLEGTLDPRGHYRTPFSDGEPSGETFVDDTGIGGSGHGGDGGEEYVIVRTQNRDEDGEEESERTVTRQQAKDFFEAEREALLRATRERRQGGDAASTRQGGASEQSTKEISATRKVASGKPISPATSKSSTPATASAKASGGGGLDVGNDEMPQAFFEIREELDEQGREVRAEAVDVSRQLAMLESDASGGVADERTMRRPHTSSSMEQSGGAPEQTAGDTTTMNDATGAAKETPSQKVISDAEYERLSARLEELALLEEQAEHNQATNTASRKGLQGGGWSSGFLNNTNKKKKKTSPKSNKPPPNSVPPPSGKSQPTTNDQMVSTIAESEPRSRAVSFDPRRNDVREIPRIGQRSALELRKPQPPPPPQAMSSVQSSTGGGGGAAAVSGVVRERVKSPSKKKQKIPLRTGGIAPAAPESASTSQPDQQQPKRLSRFAQERLRQQQEQAGR